jgi:hypothetical protein
MNTCCYEHYLAHRPVDHFVIYNMQIVVKKSIAGYTFLVQLSSCCVDVIGSVFASSYICMVDYQYNTVRAKIL